MTFATTPFGAAPLRAPVFSLDKRLARLRDETSEGSNAGAPADKWKTLRALSEARMAFGLSDRAVAVLEALAGFQPGREIDARHAAIVFPSNAELSRRTGGMAEATLRRHIAALVDAGLILRRDSPNGKRYARRDGQGAIDAAFGFDLAPLALAAPAIYAAAETVRAEERAAQAEREAISLCRRDIAKIIAAGAGEGRAGDWAGLRERLLALPARVGRGTALTALRAMATAFQRLLAQVEQAYLDALSEEEMSGNDADSGRHLQNSNPDSISESSKRNRTKPQAVEDEGNPEFDSRETPAYIGPKASGAPETKGREIALDALLAVCQQFPLYARTPIADWRDAIAVAGLVRSMLGVSPDAWEKARAAMGDRAATATIAAMLERADAIRSPGGYLRTLTARAEAGKFSVRPMLAALRGRGTAEREAEGGAQN